MIQTTIGVLAFLFFLGYLCFYIWHLFWPTVEATIENIAEGELIAPGTSYKRRHNVIVYSFEFKGKKYRSTRQGLISAKGFAKNYLLNERFILKVCPVFVQLSCPKRFIFETGMFIFWSVILLFTAYGYYNGMYGY